MVNIDIKGHIYKCNKTLATKFIVFEALLGNKNILRFLRRSGKIIFDMQISRDSIEQS